MTGSPDDRTLARNHVRFGWLMLATFATVGVALEAFHGFKSSWYLEESYETRRLLFTLGHAHGALLSIVNVLFGVATRVFGGSVSRLLPASRLLTIGTILLPAGFLIGGFGIHGSDPGIGIYLVPVGAISTVAAFVVAGTGMGEERGGDNAISTPNEVGQPTAASRPTGKRHRRR